MKTAKPSNRRNFLLAASLGTAGVAAGLTAAKKPVVKADGAAAADSQPSGYHVSAHINKYYKTTEV
jgi:hypothetical protein